MDIVIKSLFADGNNNGDVLVMCNGSSFRCHSFVICQVCPTLKTMYEHALKEKLPGQETTLAATEYSIEVMKYLISMLYNQTLGDKEHFNKFLVREHEEKEIDPATKTIQRYLSDGFLIEYIKAKDYFGIDYGCKEFPISPNVYFTLEIISNLPALSIYEPLKNFLYEHIFQYIDELDVDHPRASFLFDNPEMCKNVMRIYSKKVGKK